MELKKEREMIYLFIYFLHHLNVQTFVLLDLVLVKFVYKAKNVRMRQLQRRLPMLPMRVLQRLLLQAVVVMKFTANIAQSVMAQD